MRTSLLLALQCLLLCPSCVTHVFRLDDPAEVQRTGLDPIEDDLVLVHVVHGLFPRQQDTLLLAIPHGWGTAEVETGDEGLDTIQPALSLSFRVDHDASAPPRELRFRARDTRKWSTETRAKHQLLLAEDLPESERRSYEIINLRRADGSIDLEMRGRLGTHPVRVLGRITLPENVTGRALSIPEKVLLTPTLGAIDLAWIPITAASFIVLIPFGSLSYLLQEESDALPHWAGGEF